MPCRFINHFLTVLSISHEFEKFYPARAYREVMQ